MQGAKRFRASGCLSVCVGTRGFGGRGGLKDSEEGEYRVDEGTGVADEELLLVHVEGAHKQLARRHGAPHDHERRQDYTQNGSERKVERDGLECLYKRITCKAIDLS